MYPRETMNSTVSPRTVRITIPNQGKKQNQINCEAKPRKHPKGSLDVLVGLNVPKGNSPNTPPKKERGGRGHKVTRKKKQQASKARESNPHVNNAKPAHSQNPKGAQEYERIIVRKDGKDPPRTAAHTLI